MKKFRFITTVLIVAFGFVFSASAKDIPLRGIVHIEGIDDVVLKNGRWAGTKGESRRLEGFHLKATRPTPKMRIEYMCHLEGVGDTKWKKAGQYCGTRGQGRRLEGFAIRLRGSGAKSYRVSYKCHLQGVGDTGWKKNHEFCGTRGQGRRLESMLVRIVKK